MISSSLVTPGSLLANRYHIIRELGQGGFGRAYLAEDQNKFSEKCVLKEFAPQVQGKEVAKAKELFQREAKVLYNLDHPQIPKFRELFEVTNNQESFLFLSQEFVDGESYLSILNKYQRSGRRFTEQEIIELFQQLLPVLSYIHSANVIHRDISPDNIIKRTSDRQPVLIDFGAVKEVAGLVEQMYGKSLLGTKIGKPGYVPNEQMIRGKIYPNSDLYALAATAVTLLTGKEPKDLCDTHNGVWNWSQYVTLSPEFNRLLTKMLDFKPNNRYQSADEVLTVINGLKPTATVNPPNSTGSTTHSQPVKLPNTLVVSPDSSNPPNQPTIAIPQIDWLTPTKKVAPVIAIVFTSALLLSTIVKWVGGLFSSVPSLPPIPGISQSPTPGTKSSPNNKREEIIKKINALPNRAAVYRNIDRIFYSKHPELKGRTITDKPEDQKLRDEWFEIAEKELGK
jgi:serine/threonine-protein kinase